MYRRENCKTYCPRLLFCNVCHNNTVNCEVHLVYKNRVVQKGESAIKLENYALDNNYTPSIIKFVYGCTHCKHEKTVHQRYFTEQLFGTR